MLFRSTSGFVWSAYELAMQLMFFEAIPRRDRPCMLTYYNFGNSAAQVAGGLIGAAILQLGAEAHAAYLALFGLSSLMRLCTVPLLARTLGEGRATSAARPTTAGPGDDLPVQAPILPSLSKVG